MEGNVQTETFKCKEISFPIIHKGEKLSGSLSNYGNSSKLFVKHRNPRCDCGWYYRDDWMNSRWNYPDGLRYLVTGPFLICNEERSCNEARENFRDLYIPMINSIVNYYHGSFHTKLRNENVKVHFCNFIQINPAFIRLEMEKIFLWRAEGTRSWNE